MDAPTPTQPGPANLPGECLLAVVGIDSVLEPGPIHVTAAQLHEAAKLPQRIHDEMRRFLVATSFERERPLPQFNYRATMRRLTEPMPEAELQDMLADFGDDEALFAFSAAAGVALRYLSSILPVRYRVTVTGPRAELPSDQETSRFRRAHAVVQDPLTVLTDLAEGCLSPSQVQVLAAVYPALYTTIRAALFDCLAKITAERPKWEPSLARDRQLRVLMQTDSMSPELAIEMQRHFEQAEQQKPAGGPLQSGSQSLQTPTQRIEGK